MRSVFRVKCGFAEQWSWRSLGEIRFQATTTTTTTTAHYHLPGNVGGFTFVPHVNGLIITGPFDGLRPDSTPSRDKVLTCRPSASLSEDATAPGRFSRGSRSESLSPVRCRTPGSRSRCCAEYQEGRKEGDFETASSADLQMILSDPEFIYRTESRSGERRTDPGQNIRRSVKWNSHRVVVLPLEQPSR